MADGDVVVIDTEFETDARAQFIALGVGVIVGRCGGSSPVSALTPSSLSILGRDWIVFPARVVVAKLARRDAKKYVKISVSPTLGLVGHPTIVPFGRHQVSSFFHWVGPLSCGDRFALVFARVGANHDPWELEVCAIDTRFSGQRRRDDDALAVGGGERDVKLIMRVDLSRPWCSNRRWVVGSGAQGGFPTALSLWNLDGVEHGDGTESRIEVTMPGMVARMAFGGCKSGSSLVVQWKGGVLLIDLEATAAQNRLVSTPLSFITLDDGNTFTCLLCLSTGQRRAIRPETTCAIGGPYAAIYRYQHRDYTEIEVYSMFEPTKVCCTHRAQRGRQRLEIGNETVLLDDDVSIRVIDAVSGLLLCKMFVKGFRATEISNHSNNRQNL
ncbi:hypothetical protein Pelo_4873 [Pelomyxa schiedti]|nr:hypothetical protein Pelo_4873 [Pelomyxa schiedti]